MLLKHSPEDFIVEEVADIKLESSGRYTYFILEKRGIGTEDAVQTIAKQLNIVRKNISYSGAKDKEAVTRQYVSIFGISKEYEDDKIKLKKIGVGNIPLTLGSHTYNRFTITVRDIEKKPEPKESFINYFGDQRFGRSNLQIGLAILKRDFRKAASLIDDPNTIAHLKNRPTEFVNAIRLVPMNILMFYIGSVQSYIFNEAAYSIAKTQQAKLVKYSQGEYAFSDVKDRKLPLLTFDTELGEDENLYNEVLKKLGITQRDFVMREMSGLTPMGDLRELVAHVDDIKCSELEHDEVSGKKKIKIEFSLPVGSYATVYIASVF